MYIQYSTNDKCVVASKKYLYCNKKSNVNTVIIYMSVKKYWYRKIIKKTVKTNV